MAGTSAKRVQPRSNFAPPVPFKGPSTTEGGLTKTVAPSLKKEPADDVIPKDESDIEAYSDPDEGVEIVDINDVKRLDWMAPESLSKEKPKSAKKGRSIVKKESRSDIKGKTKGMYPTHICLLCY